MQIGSYTSERPILPRGKTDDRALLIIMSIMVFLSILTLVTAMSGLSAAKTWQDDLHNTATIQLYPMQAGDIDGVGQQAVDNLRSDYPALEITMLSEDQSQALLSPWLGSVALPEDLPVPVLVSVTSLDKAPLPLEGLKETLAALNIDADIDDHSRWRDNIDQTWRSVRISLLTFLGLILTASIVIVSFATRATIKVRDRIISVLDQVGASDFYIIRLFAIRFLWLGAVAALCGGLMAD